MVDSIGFSNLLHLEELEKKVALFFFSELKFECLGAR